MRDVLPSSPPAAHGQRQGREAVMRASPASARPPGQRSRSADHAVPSTSKPAIWPSDWLATPSVRRRGRAAILRVQTPARTSRRRRSPRSRRRTTTTSSRSSATWPADRYQTFFLDSITQLSRQCFATRRSQYGQRPHRQARPARGLWPARPGNDRRSPTCSTHAARTWCSSPSSMKASDDYNRQCVRAPDRRQQTSARTARHRR